MTSFPYIMRLNGVRKTERHFVAMNDIKSLINMKLIRLWSFFVSFPPEIVLLISECIIFINMA